MQPSRFTTGTLRPIFGFGPIGYAGLLVFVALAYAHWVAGADLVHRAVSAVYTIGGFNGFVWFFSRVWFPQSFQLFDAVPWDLFAAAYGSVWLYLHPSRLWLPRAGLLLTAILAHGALYVEVHRLPFRAALQRETLVLFAELIGGVPVCIAVLCITRRWLPSVAAIAVTISSASAEAFVDMSTFMLPARLWPELWLPLAHHGVLCASLGVWSLKARWAIQPPGCCQSCGYPIAGLPEAKCPECGSAISHPPVVAAGALQASDAVRIADHSIT